MALSRIEDLVDDICAYVEGCKLVPMSQNRVIINKDELFDKLDELRNRTPDEIKRYQRIISQRDAIIAQAEEHAKQIEEEARQVAQQMISENEIMKQAYSQANDLVREATENAERITREAETNAETLKNGILDYSNDVMNEIERILSTSFIQCQETSEKLLGVLKENLDTVHADQEELRQQIDGDTDDSSDDGFYDFPADKFLEGIEE